MDGWGKRNRLRHSTIGTLVVVVGFGGCYTGLAHGDQQPADDQDEAQLLPAPREVALDVERVRALHHGKPEHDERARDAEVAHGRAEDFPERARYVAAERARVRVGFRALRGLAAAGVAREAHLLLR